MMNRINNLLFAVVTTTTLMFVSAYTVVLPEKGYKIGDYVTDFSLPNIDGKNLSLKDFTDAKGFILIFTCNTCPYAKAYEARIIELDKQFANKGFPVIAINPNDVSRQPGDSMEKMIKRAKDKGYTFPYLRDDSQEVTRTFGALKTPHAFVLNKENDDKIKIEFIGAIDNSPRSPNRVSETYVEDVVNALLSGETPKVREKKSIGCGIKWKNT